MGVDKGSGGMCARRRHPAAGACNAPLRRDTAVVDGPTWSPGAAGCGRMRCAPTSGRRGCRSCNVVARRRHPTAGACDAPLRQTAGADGWTGVVAKRSVVARRRHRPAGACNAPLRQGHGRWSCNVVARRHHTAGACDAAVRQTAGADGWTGVVAKRSAVARRRRTATLELRDRAAPSAASIAAFRLAGWVVERRRERKVRMEGIVLCNDRSPCGRTPAGGRTACWRLFSCDRQEQGIDRDPHPTGSQRDGGLLDKRIHRA